MLGFNPFLQNVPGAGFWPGQMAQDPRLAFMQRRQMPMAQPIQATPFATPPAVARAPFLMPPHQTQVPQPGAIGRALAGPQQGTQTPQASQSAANGQVVAPSQAAPQLTRPRVMPLGTQEERNAFYADRGVWASEMPEGTTFAPLGRPLRHSEPMAQSTFLAPADLPEPPAASETFSDMQAPPGPASLMPMPERQPRSRLQQFGLDVQDGLNRVGEAFTPERMDALALFTNLIDAGRAKWLGEWDDGRAAGWGAAADAIQTYQDRGEARDIREEERARAQAAEKRAAAAEVRAAVEAKQDAVRFEWEGKDAAEEERQRQSLEAWINTRPEAERVALRAQPEIAREMMVREIVPADFEPDGAGRFVRFNRQTGAPEYFTNADGSVFEAPLSEREQYDRTLTQEELRIRRNAAARGERVSLSDFRQIRNDYERQMGDVSDIRLRVQATLPFAQTVVQSQGRPRGFDGAVVRQQDAALVYAAARLVNGPGVLSDADLQALSAPTMAGVLSDWTGFATGNQRLSDAQRLALATVVTNNVESLDRRAWEIYDDHTAFAQDNNVDPARAGIFAPRFERPGAAGPDFSAMTDAQLTQQLDNEALTDAQIDALEAEWARRRGGGGAAPTATDPARNSLNNPLADWAD
jgi:hypothetical protein